MSVTMWIFNFEEPPPWKKSKRRGDDQEGEGRLGVGKTGTPGTPAAREIACVRFQVLRIQFVLPR
jgi:hypothetical protein